MINHDDVFVLRRVASLSAFGPNTQFSILLGMPGSPYGVGCRGAAGVGCNEQLFTVHSIVDPRRTYIDEPVFSLHVICTLCTLHIVGCHVDLPSQLAAQNRSCSLTAVSIGYQP